MIDLNSHYPNCLANIRCPDLRTQTIHEYPLKRGFTVKEVIEHIGISRCAVKITKKTKFGQLPIRMDDATSTYPNKEGQILIGTWTHQELNKATKEGWEILDIEWTHTWEETENPFKNIMQKLYEYKQNAKDEVEKGFAKMLLNGGIGKLAQRREQYDMQWVSIERHNEMLKEGYECIETAGTERLYRKTMGITYPSYYAPVINCMVTADARIKILEMMEQLEEQNVYYVDTDSIIGDASNIRQASFKYGKSMGEWKKEIENTQALIYGKKSYMIGEEVKLSGVGKNWITKEDFEKGIITYKRMKTEGTTPNKEEIGTFETLTRDLKQTMIDAMVEKQELEDKKILIDKRSENTKLIERVPEWMD